MMITAQVPRHGIDWRSALMRGWMLLIVSHFIEEQETTAVELSQVQCQALDRLVDQAVALGLPDFRGARLFVGQLVIRRTDRINLITADGMHARLADGTWLVGLALPVAPGTATVRDTGVREITVAESTDAVVSLPRYTRMGIDPEQWAGQRSWYTSAERDLIGQLQASPWCCKELVGLSGGMSITPRLTRTMRAVVCSHLWRSAHPEAGIAVLGLALWAPPPVAEVIPPLRFKPWTLGRAPIIRLLTPEEIAAGEPQTFPSRGGLAEGLPAKPSPPEPGSLILPDPVEELRRQLVAWCGEQFDSIQPPFMAMAPKRALAMARALVRPHEVEVIAWLDAMERNLACRQNSAGTDLESRLRSWRVPPAGVDSAWSEPGLQFWQTVRPEDLPLRSGIAEAGKVLAEQEPLPFTREDLPGLMDLLDDPGPSPWIDQDKPRTLGELALRVVARLLLIDPRVIVGINPGTPWTQKEQQVVASALRDWWHRDGHLPVSQLVAAIAPDLRPEDQITLLRLAHNLDPEMRDAILNRLADCWRAGPPMRDTELLNDVLALAARHEAMNRTVAGWIGIQELRPIVSMHLLRQGSSHAAEEWMNNDLLVDDPSSANALREMHSARRSTEELLPEYVTMLTVVPHPRILLRLQQYLAADQHGPVYERLVKAIAQNKAHPWLVCDYLQKLIIYHQGIRDISFTESRMRLTVFALCAQLVNDRRPASVELRREFADRVRRDDQLSDREARKTPEDLRIADVVAALVTVYPLKYELVHPGEDWRSVAAELFFPLGSSLAERDAAITRVNDRWRVILPPLLRAAGLPETIPGMPPAGPRHEAQIGADDF